MVTSFPRGIWTENRLPWHTPLPTTASNVPRTVGLVPYTLLKKVTAVEGRQLLITCLHALLLPSPETEIGLNTLLGASNCDTRHLNVEVPWNVSPSWCFITSPVIFGGFKRKTSLFVIVESRVRVITRLPLKISLPSRRNRDVT